MKKVSVEDYLRTLYHLYEKDKKGVMSKDLAKELKISKPSVSEMLKKLMKSGFIKFEPYSDIYFTKKGLRKAKEIMHSHRVIEVFLSKVLKYELPKVHDEAHRLEHAFSAESIKRLDKFLKNPSISPSGKKIPHEK